MVAAAQPLISLPDSLRAHDFTLRHERDTDAPFLERLYVSVRWPELEPTSWSDESKVAFLSSQFELQRIHYLKHYHDAMFSILEWQSHPLGRLYLFRGPEDHRIVDISLLPEARNKGIGAALLSAVIDEAASHNKSVSIHVEKFNPARRLYDRLGFAEAGESGPYWLMIRSVSPSHAARNPNDSTSPI